MRRVLSIHEKGIEDLGDLLAIARAEGKKAFRTKERIRVLPEVWKKDEFYLVTVEYDGVDAANHPKEGDKMMKKVKWAIPTAVLVLAMVLGYALISAPAPNFATVKVGTNVVWAADTTYSHIENVYILKNTHAAGFDMDFGDPANQENVLGIITASGGSVNIPYETPFKIVVAVTGKAPENLAYVVKENIKVELAVSGSFTIAQENSIDANEYVFENSGYGTSSGYLRMNVVWDNAGNGYTLPAGGSVTLDPIRLWCWW
jgi:hypothetical protein